MVPIWVCGCGREIPMEKTSQSDQRGFAIGDTVRLLTDEWAGRVGTITDRAHPDSPWTWVVRGAGEEGPGYRWGTAVDESEIAHAPVEDRS